ncbi:MAG: hypothetical protein AAF580_08655 [Pseudomonadota bacterium]
MAQTGSNRSFQAQDGDLLLLPPQAGASGAGQAGTIEADYVLVPVKPASTPDRIIRGTGPAAKPMLQRPGHDARAIPDRMESFAPEKPPAFQRPEHFARADCGAKCPRAFLDQVGSPDREKTLTNQRGEHLICAQPDAGCSKAFDGVPAEDLAALTKGLRRRWLSAGFKRSQHTLLLVRLSGEATAGRRVAKALGAALAPLGDVYSFGPMGQALVAPEKPVRHIVTIAQSIRSAVMGESGHSVFLSAGVALIHRDDDTTYTLCTAERNLRKAEAAPGGAVVTSADGMAPRRDARAVPDRTESFAPEKPPAFQRGGHFERAAYGAKCPGAMADG